jgi:hypothetical protein
VHAWHDSYGRERYFEEASEAVADRFASAVFERMGGRIGDFDVCSSYELPVQVKAFQVGSDLEDLLLTLEG